MAIDPTSMNTLLAKLEAARAALGTSAASGPAQLARAAESGAGAASGAKPVDFAALLKQSLAAVDQTQQQAMTLADRFQIGDPKVSLEETMVALAKANVSFQQLVQVRNRMITAYHDVMNLQV